jgi:3-oxoacyl-[acyl-carrier-protein] synthase-3
MRAVSHLDLPSSQNPFFGEFVPYGCLGYQTTIGHHLAHRGQESEKQQGGTDLGCTIVGTGACLPRRRVGNDELATMMDTSDEWIVKRTGIHARHIAITETATDLGAKAATEALRGFDGTGCEPGDVDLIICATLSADAAMPSQAALLKRRLGLSRALAFDLNAACTGSIYGMVVAESMMQASQLHPTGMNPIRHALVVGVERLSRIVDWDERATCVLFGDGAGAVLLEWDETKPGILSSHLASTDDVDDTLVCGSPFAQRGTPFGDGEPAMDSDDELQDLLATSTVHMKGQKVFKFASNALVEAAHVTLERAGLGLDEISIVVPHQANERIIRYAARKLGLPMERFQLSIAESANTSAASPLIALHDAYGAGRIQAGDTVLMVGFGGGLTSGGLLFEA